MNTINRRAASLMSAALQEHGSCANDISALLSGQSLSQLRPGDPLLASGIATQNGALATAAVRFPDAPFPLLREFDHAADADLADAAIKRHLSSTLPPAPLCVLAERSEIALSLRLRAHGHRVIPLPIDAVTAKSAGTLASGLAQAEAQGAVLVIENADDFLAIESEELEIIHAHEGPLLTLSMTHAVLHAIIGQSHAAVVLGIAPGKALPLPSQRLITLRAAPGRPVYADRLEETQLLAAELAAELSPQQISALARPDVPARQRRNMIYATMLTGTTETALATLPSASVLAPAHTDDFQIDQVNTDKDIASLIERLRASGSRRLRFLFSGPPGTGKSSLAAHIAREIGYEPRVVPASDIENSKVGETEKAIAAMFKRASAQREALILDEADSLVMDRSLSTWAYDMSRTNAFLQWLDPHDQPFFLTTNHADRIDPAIKRRLLFKIEVKALRPDQRAIAWTRNFGRPAPLSLASLDGLTSSDFSLVRERVELLGLLGNDAAILDELKVELESRGEIKARIGFH